MGQNLGKFWSINWYYFGPNMVNIYCWANYGQNMDHKLVKIWSKLDHGKVGAKYGKSMVHKLGKIWARFGQNRNQCYLYLFCLCIWCVFVCWCVMFGVFVVVFVDVLVTVIYKGLINVYKSL